MSNFQLVASTTYRMSFRLCSPHQFGPGFRVPSHHCFANLQRQITVSHISTPSLVPSSATPLFMWIKCDFNQHSSYSFSSLYCHMYEKYNKMTAGMANLLRPSPGLLCVCVCVCMHYSLCTYVCVCVCVRRKRVCVCAHFFAFQVVLMLMPGWLISWSQKTYLTALASSWETDRQKTKIYRRANIKKKHLACEILLIWPRRERNVVVLDGKTRLRVCRHASVSLWAKC